LLDVICRRRKKPGELGRANLSQPLQLRLESAGEPKHLRSRILRFTKLNISLQAKEAVTRFGVDRNFDGPVF
jgi:hypothetical protein